MFRKFAWIAAVCLLGILLSVTVMAAHSNVYAATVAGGSRNSSTWLLDDQGTAEKLELTCQYPVISSYAGLNYSYSVSVTYSGKDSKVFDLNATVPPGFVSTITPGYGEGQEIAAIRLDGNKGYPETIKLNVRPYAWKVPIPGEYPIVFAVSSGAIKSTIDLKAIVTANYDLKMTTPDGRLNTEATAGQESTFTVVIGNSGSADLEKIEVSCPSKDKPGGWTVTCKPDKIDSLKAGDTKEVQVTVKPSEKTISGDYMLTVQAEPESRNAFSNIQIRTTVLTPTIWGWVGVGIVVLVIVALAVIFIRFGRR